MGTYQTFLFKNYSFDPGTGELTLRYAFDQGPEFVERVVFPLLHASPQRMLGSHLVCGEEENKWDASLRWHDGLSDTNKEVLDQAFRLIFLLAGVSYYKAAIPPRLRCEAFDLSQDMATFCHKVYENGLGEFAYRNKVKLDFQFESTSGVIDTSAAQLELPDRLLVPVGGGKDSIVTIEALKRAGKDVTLFALGGENLAQPISETIRVSGLPFIHVKRFLAPQLMELNKQGALNGHVPITAILSAIASACAVLYGFKAVVLSNEASANAPNVVCDGREINHQYSKSFAFEKDFDAVVKKTVCSNLDYYSLLRPLTETAIAARFARLEKYHHVFRSCNTAFKQDEAKRGTRWCCDCPKCRFVFLALAPFMAKEKLVALFGRDLLDDQAQLDGFRELCGLSAIKPFECVGEVEESRALIAKLSTMPAWHDDAVVKTLASDCTSALQTFDGLMAMRGPHALSAEMISVIASKIVIWGAGREGCAAARFMRGRNSDVDIVFVDESEKAALPDDLAALRIVNGEKEMAGVIMAADLVIKSPGVSLYHPVLEGYRRKGGAVTSLLNLWAATCPPEKLIAVTGTKGKSTTSSLLAHVLNALGKKTALLGNIGTPVSECNPQDYDYCVVEVSSYQAANFEGRCGIAALISLFPEHLDWHKTQEVYYRDKCNLLRHADKAFVEAAAYNMARSQGIALPEVQLFHAQSGYHIDGNCVRRGGELLGNVENEFLLRPHNHGNVYAVLAIVEACGLDPLKATEAMGSYKGLPHRQQIIGERDGIVYVDDSISTTPQSAIAALEVFAGRPITLIAGGQDRGVDYTPLVDYVAAREIAVMCLGECGVHLQALLSACGFDGTRLVLTGSMEEAISAAQNLTPKGGVILLSPAAPSYDMFKDFIDRANQFAKASGFVLSE